MRRHHFPRALITALCSLLALAAGCVDGYPEETGEVASAVTLTEGFEAGAKGAYAVADVTLGSGVWTLADALIGNTAADPKVGAQSTRVRNSGKVTMKFDRTTGAGVVTIRHAVYGTDASGTWGLYTSQNAGVTWTQVGPTQVTSGSALGTASFTVSLAGTVRFEIRKLDGGTNRICFDDVNISDFGGGGGGGGSGGAAVSVHTTMGLPTAATTTDWNNYLSVKSGYVLSYNSGRKGPNWVSWKLNSSYLGSTPRQDTFRPDDTLPSGMPQAQLSDYSGSGYDRGHMCPSGDRTLTTTANSQTFYLSNMVPQAGANNQGPWNDLEVYSRSLAQAGKDLFIISGGAFSTSSGTVGNGLKVPDSTWKVIVVLDSLGQGASAVTSSTRVIAVKVPNNNSISSSTPWRNFRVTVDSIEALTGQNYLSDVDPTVQSVVEARVDTL